MKNYLFIVFCYWNVGLFGQGLYVYGGGSASGTLGYNNDKDSEYFPAENFERSLVYLFPTFGIGYSWNSAAQFLHRVDISFRRIEIGAQYDDFLRPNNAGFVNQFGLIRPIGLHRQGVRSEQVVIRYATGKAFANKNNFQWEGSFSFSQGLINRFYDYLESTEGDERRRKMGRVPDQYFRPFNIGIGGGVSYQLTKLIDLTMSYEVFLLPINRTVDAVMIRRYHPQVASLTLRIYSKR